MAPDTQDRTAAGCLALFALPFAAIGVAALYFFAATLLDWHGMRGWISVPATLDRLELEEHDGDDSTTYEVAASYRYRYDGREYSGTRVAISSVADNIGNFQQDLYASLRAAEQRGNVTAFVDPDDPARATLNRDLRWPLLSFQGVFALVFGGIGSGLLIGGRIGVKKLGEVRELQRQFPQEPWRWRKEWASTQIRGSNRATAYVSAGFAVLWNLISLPVIFVVPRAVAEGNTLALVALLFPLIGIGLAVWAIRAWLQLKRFGVSTLELQRIPVVLGARLRGTVRVAAEVPVSTAFRVELTCIRHDQRGRGRNSESIERTLWQNERTVPRTSCSITPTGTSIPVDIPVPVDQPAMSNDDGRISWRLDVSGECPGPDYWSRFELPVFDVPEQRDAQSPATAAVGPASGQPDRGKLESLGIAYERLPGGEAWTFRRGQHKKVAALLTLFCAVWTAISVGLLWSDAPLLFPIVAGLFDLLLVWCVLTLWFTEYRVTLDDRMLTLVKRGFGGRAPVAIPRAMVRDVRARSAMQAGNKLYYDLRVETGGKTHTAAASLADYEVAVWLANHWAGGRSEPAR